MLKTKGIILTAVSALFLGAPISHAQALKLTDALNLAYRENPELAARRGEAEAASAAIRSQYWLSNPKIGWMRENNLNLTQELMGPMEFWTVSQEVMFPTKYFTLGSAQKSRAEAAEQEALDAQLSVRQKVISRYFELFAASRIASLLEAQKETIREIARVAEARRATGGVPQQDEMKAHVEQTKIENEILLQRQEQEEARAMFNALLNRAPDEVVSLDDDSLKTPKLTLVKNEILPLARQNSKMIASRRAMWDEAQTMKTMALTNYLPDFMVSYRKAYSNAPENAYAFSVEASIPLWFFMKQTSEYSAASARSAAAEKALETTTRQTEAETLSLLSKVEAYEKLLKIYETSLVPQATSTLNSSRAAYSAGRTTFLELLDSERSLYEVRISYYRTLAKFVENLTQLERIVGKAVSTLPIGGES